MFVDLGNLRNAIDWAGAIPVSLLAAQRIGMAGARVCATPAMPDDVSGKRCR